MANSKTAFVLFADTPLLGQAGNRYHAIFSDHQRQQLFTNFITDFNHNCQQLQIDLWLTCEEIFQDNLLLQHFPDVKGTKVARGPMNQRLVELTNYFLTYQDYAVVVFIFDAFTFIGGTISTQLSQHFRLTKRGLVLLVDENTKQLEALALSFPFTRVFEDITWGKASIQKDLKQECKNNGTPCKVLTCKQLALNDPLNQAASFIETFGDELPTFRKTLASITKPMH